MVSAHSSFSGYNTILDLVTHELDVMVLHKCWQHYVKHWPSFIEHFTLLYSKDY